MKAFTTIGSSYRLDQSPGAECVGGCSVKLRRCAIGRGSITVEHTSHPFSSPVGHGQIGLDSCINATIEGIRASANALRVDLTEYAVTVGEFLWIERDSKRSAPFRLAGSAAFEAALAARFGEPDWPRVSLLLPSELND